jgi:hypothetical protein
VIDGFLGLRHNTRIRGNDQHDDIGDLRTPGAHGRKGLVTRRIEKRDRPMLCFDLVRRDVLGNPARFAGDDVRFPYVIEERCLSMVHMSHDRDHRSALLQNAAGIIILFLLVGGIFGHELRCIAELIG